MITKFLKDELGLLEESRRKLADEIYQEKREIKETSQFIDILSSQIDEEYEAFSPLDVNRETHQKVQELKKKRRTLEARLNEKQQVLLSLDNRIVLYHSMINRSLILEDEEQENISKNAKDGLGDFDNRFFRLKLLETQEAERKRIARDLHDSIVQDLTAMTHKLELCSRLIDTDPIRSKHELMNTSKNMRDTIADMRQVIYDLTPLSLDDMGLKIALEREMRILEKDGGVRIDLDMSKYEHGIEAVMALTLFRIIKEACVNAIKHAEATYINVEVSSCKNEIEVYIRDDGIGFDTTKTFDYKREGKRFGLTTMKERIYLLSGTLNISSVVGEGTEIHVVVPLEIGEENGN